jgi:dUTP pyrophosphatase
MQIKAKKLHPDAKMPKFALKGDVGMDLFSLEDHIIKPKEVVRVATGIAFELPDVYAGRIWDKGGVSGRGLKTVGGVFDSNYRGDLTVQVVNLVENDYIIKKGDKVAQILIQKIETPTLVEVEELSDSNRGSSRFGSTGIK